MGSSIARVTCEASQVLLAGGQVVCLGDLPLLSHLPIDSAQDKKEDIYIGSKANVAHIRKFI